MKHYNLNLSITILFIVFIFSINNLKAQTASYTIIQQPCAADGIVAVTVDSGLTPPLTFYYTDCSFNETIHSNIYSMSDTIFNCYACYIANGNGIFASVSDTLGNTISLSIPFDLPFVFDSIVGQPLQCPDSIQSIEFFIGGTSAANVKYYNVASNHFYGSPIITGNPASLPIGMYDYIVVDSNDCEIRNYEPPLEIQSSTNIDYDIITTEAACTNGTAVISNLTGVVQPVTYQWSNGLTADSIGNLSAIYYDVTVTDSIGCTKRKSFYITQNSNISINYTVTEPTCSQNDGNITAYGSGGVSPYSYQWDTGSLNQTIDNLSSGYYHVTVTDADGCFKTGSKSLANSSPITVSYSTIPTACNDSTGSATLTINGGTAPYTVNWSTYPAQTGITANNLVAGIYHFEVIDSVSCVKTGDVIVGDEGNIDTDFFITNETCNQENGQIVVIVSGNFPPFTIDWSNGETDNIIDSLQAGSYTCTITDTNGCFVERTKHVLEVSPMNLTFTTNPSSCIFTPDGSITVNVIGGTPPYTYNWTGGQTTQTAIDLLSDDYICVVIDANGCQVSEHIYLDYDHSNDSCYCTVTGKVFVDGNSNCSYNYGEELVENIEMHCDYFGYNFTNSNGEYSFIVPSGNYTLSEIIQGYYPLSTCQSNSINITANAASGCVITNNFAHSINPIRDIKVTSNTQHAVPGEIYYQHIFITNEGTIPEGDIQFSYSHDGQLQFSNSSVALTQYSSNWYGINSGFSSLNPSETEVITVNYNVPVNIPLGTEVMFYDTVSYANPISNWSNDYSPWDNVLTYPVTIIGSFDPNNKEVIPKGIGEEGFITTNDSILTYTINFENTGTYYASRVVVVDTLDSDLDLHSIHLGYSNHNYTANLSEDGVLTFIFDNINLYYHGEEAKGYVTFTIKQKPLLVAGTTIENKASIFFDYNAPILTNTVINTILYPSDIESKNKLNNSFDVYPNPTKGVIKIVFNDKQYKNNTIQIISINGEILKQLTNINSEQIINLSNYEKGIYFVRNINNNTVSTKKIILY